MPIHAIIISPDYRAVVRGLRELHHLTVAGKLNSPEADAIRDATDGPWEALDETEKKRVAELSEDLYAITNPARDNARQWKPEAQMSLVKTINKSIEIGDWNQALALIRRSAAQLKPALVSFLRGTAWSLGGDQETAAIFHKHAQDLQPDYETSQAIDLTIQDQSDPIAAREKSTQRF